MVRKDALIRVNAVMTVKMEDSGAIYALTICVGTVTHTIHARLKDVLPTLMT